MSLASRCSTVDLDLSLSISAWRLTPFLPIESTLPTSDLLICLENWFIIPSTPTCSSVGKVDSGTASSTTVRGDSP